MKHTTHTKALSLIKLDADHPSLAWFKPYLANFDKWGVDRLGSIPTPAMIAVATATCKNGPGVEGVNVAMACRPEGVAVSQYLGASGAEGAAHNHLGTLVKGGIFDDIPRGAKVKCATLTEYGAREVDRLMIAKGMKAAPKAAAVKVARKHNAKAAPAVIETPISDAPSATEGTTSLPATVEAIADLAAHFNS